MNEKAGFFSEYFFGGAPMFPERKCIYFILIILFIGVMTRVIYDKYIPDVYLFVIISFSLLILYVATGKRGWALLIIVSNIASFSLIREIDDVLFLMLSSLLLLVSSMILLIGRIGGAYEDSYEVVEVDGS